jgi:hypothetical protein
MLSTAVSGKASQSSVDGLGVSIGAALTAIATKSSQSSVDTVSTKVDTKASQSSLDALNASVATQTQVSNLGTSVNTANTTLASLGLAVAALPQHADLASVQSTVLGQIGTRASQASVDALSSALGTNGDLGVKLEIERALIDGKRIVSFVLPESVGGHLERVRDIVDELLTDGQAAGFDVTKARAHFAKAETARTAGDYKTAYDEYAAAYQALIK